MFSSVNAIGRPLLRRCALIAPKNSYTTTCSSIASAAVRRPSTPPPRPLSSPLLGRLAMAPSNQINYSSSATSEKRPHSEPRPSSSVLLLSPQNQVLLLHRVQTSTSFASAHVFPGGNLDVFHDGVIPAVGSPERHQDGLAYRLGAIRETFEETGILLAKKDGELVNLSSEERDQARVKIHGNQVNFQEWVASLGAEPDIGS
jgi:8-oxo-dGTP pyrophosphatase MutT (NUDIX family)